MEVRFDAKQLGEILGAPAIGFDLYVWKDKSVLSYARLLELAQKLSPQPGRKHLNLSKRGI